MRLPVPNNDDVEEFKKLYRWKFKMELTDAEALDVATRFIQLYYLTKHEIHSIQSEE